MYQPCSARGDRALHGAAACFRAAMIVPSTAILLLIPAVAFYLVNQLR